MDDAASYGERKHETCRFGTLTKAWRTEYGGGAEKPTVAPLCTWKLPEPCPPGLERQWGGLVEYERDCALCLAHQPVEIAA